MWNPPKSSGERVASAAGKACRSGPPGVPVGRFRVGFRVRPPSKHGASGAGGLASLPQAVGWVKRRFSVWPPRCGPRSDARHARHKVLCYGVLSAPTGSVRGLVA